MFAKLKLALTGLRKNKWLYHLLSATLGSVATMLVQNGTVPQEVMDALRVLMTALL